MTAYMKSVRSNLISIDAELQKVLEAYEEDEQFIQNIQNEMEQLEEEEIRVTETAKDEICAIMRTKERAKLDAASRDIAATHEELGARWEAAQKDKTSLEHRGEVVDGQLVKLREELARLEKTRKKRAAEFEKKMKPRMANVTKLANGPTGTDEQERALRKESMEKVADSIFIYQKNPKSKIPLKDLLPIDKSIGRIYQHMSYLTEGKFSTNK